jgi:hypothetical protein
MLRTLRPDVHFILGEKSSIAFPDIRKPDLNRVEQRQEEMAVLRKTMADYLALETTEWKVAETKQLDGWRKLTLKEKPTRDTEYFGHNKTYDKDTKKLVKSLSSML